MSCTGKKMKGGSDNIPLYSDTSTDWHMKGKPSNLAVDLNVGINEYQFGRPTPDNKFVVSTGLVNKPFGVEMVGSGKKKIKKAKKNNKESLSILNKIKKSFTNIVKGISIVVTAKKSNVKKPMKKVTKKPMKKVTKKPMKKVTKKPMKKVSKKPMKKVTKK